MTDICKRIKLFLERLFCSNCCICYESEVPSNPPAPPMTPSISLTISIPKAERIVALEAIEAK